jgi:hypothetical protein
MVAMLVAPDKLVLVPSATYKTANHGKAFTAVQECCDQHCFARGATARPVLDAFDDSRGHLVRRRVFVCPEAAGLEALDAWSGCIPYWR